MVTTTSTSRPERSEILRKLIRSYYEVAKLDLPQDMELREFAVQPFDSESYVRHLSFSNEPELREFLVKVVPLQVYFSAGKYQTPSAKDMESMGWMGSDLMFDLDAEEFCSLETKRFCPDTGEEEVECKTSETIDYTEVTTDCLKLVYRKAVELTKILKEDFGLEGEIIFSGNRGFHVNVDCYGDCALLDREDRKEIVEYLTEPKVEPGRPEDVGWAGRLARGFEPINLDAQVTIDIYRLRRIPGSINGKSGLPVFKVRAEEDLDNLFSKSPFSGKVVIDPLITGHVRAYEMSFELERGRKEVVEAGVGVFLSLKGLARLIAYVK